jgi:hypothetical protein
MDLSITKLTPEHHQARGAQAFDEGLGEHDHELPVHSSARRHWQYGWHNQRIERSRSSGNQMQQLAEVSPP